ncbi:MAG: hypothetical protein U0175_26765 [Caldilineaceae bacterium]
MPKKQIPILLLLLIWLLAGCTGAQFHLIVPMTPTPTQATDELYSTPDEAVTAYFAALSQADPTKLLQASAVEEMSERFDFAASIDRLQAFLPTQSLAPTADPFYVELNKIQLSSQILNQVKMFSYSLLSQEAVDKGSPIIQMGAERVAQFQHDVDPSRLAAIQVERIDLPNKAIMQESKYLENAAKIARIYGADEMTERVVLFSFEEKEYLLGFTLLRYGETWKISSATSPLAGTSATGVAQPTTLEEFESMTSQ